MGIAIESDPGKNSLREVWGCPVRHRRKGREEKRRAYQWGGVVAGEGPSKGGVADSPVAQSSAAAIKEGPRERYQNRS